MGEKNMRGVFLLLGKGEKNVSGVLGVKPGVNIGILLGTYCLIGDLGRLFNKFLELRARFKAFLNFRLIRILPR
jgi:hypothetical protein